MEKLLATRHIRIKILEPKKGIYNLFFRSCRIFFRDGQLCYDNQRSDVLSRLFSFLFQGGFFAYEDSAVRYINTLLNKGYSLLPSISQERSKSLYRVSYCCYFQELPICRITFLLMILPTEAILSTILQNYKNNDII